MFCIYSFDSEFAGHHESLDDGVDSQGAWLRSEALRAAEDRLQLLSAEIADKQVINYFCQHDYSLVFISFVCVCQASIQQYIAEAAERMDHLQACGQEIVSLRQQVNNILLFCYYNSIVDLFMLSIFCDTGS